MQDRGVEYASDEQGQPVAVLVPIALWREIEETEYLLKSDAMKKRLLESKDRQDAVPLEDAP
jgi:PHD/YefM family antitoxin component YafN of YafNO toxin-antitoxin module